MEAVYIVGVGMTPFGKRLERSVKDLTREAVTAALGDAGCARSDLEAAYFSNACQGHMEGQDLIRGEIALRTMGIEGIPVTNVENACASASTALHGAVQFLRAGMGEIALAVGVDKMYSTDRAKMFSAFESGWDVETAEENRRRLLALGSGVDVPEGTTSPRPYSAMMDVYAAWARFLFFRPNPRGSMPERWVHTAGCRRWFNLVRDTVTYKITSLSRGEGET